MVRRSPFLLRRQEADQAACLHQAEAPAGMTTAGFQVGPDRLSLVLLRTSTSRWLCGVNAPPILQNNGSGTVNTAERRASYGRPVGVREVWVSAKPGERSQVLQLQRTETSGRGGP